jgi:hypothetical protein
MFENQDDREPHLRYESRDPHPDAKTRELNRERGHEPKDEYAELQAVQLSVPPEPH